MTDMNVLPVNDNQWGGLGGGFLGGILGGALFGGGFGGWNRNGASGGAGAYDAGLLTGIGNQITHANDAAVAAQMSILQSASNQNMFMGNLVNQTGDAITGAINQGTITGLQNTGVLQQNLCVINNNITTQGY